MSIRKYVLSVFTEYELIASFLIFSLSDYVLLKRIKHVIRKIPAIFQRTHAPPPGPNGLDSSHGPFPYRKAGTFPNSFLCEKVNHTLALRLNMYDV